MACDAVTTFRLMLVCDVVSIDPEPAPSSDLAQREQLYRRKQRQRRSRPGFVYFIGRADGDGPVKIGFSVNPQARLSNLQIGNGLPLVVLATKTGTRADERALHARFKASRVHGEWFDRAPDLEQFMSECAE